MDKDCQNKIKDGHIDIGARGYIKAIQNVKVGYEETICVSC